MFPRVCADEQCSRIRGNRAVDAINKISRVGLVDPTLQERDPGAQHPSSMTGRKREYPRASLHTNEAKGRKSCAYGTGYPVQKSADAFLGTDLSVRTASKSRDTNSQVGPSGGSVILSHSSIIQGWSYAKKTPRFKPPLSRNIIPSHPEPRFRYLQPTQ
jgi:hypothetical protein